MTQLSRYVDIARIQRSHQASRWRIDNTIPPESVAAFARLAKQFDRVVDHFKRQPDTSSWYRCPRLNRLVKGRRDSRHLGLAGSAAVDLEIFGIPNSALAKWIADNCEHDEVIVEFHNPAEGPNSGWVHWAIVLPVGAKDGPPGS
jgi:hypothetical protein